MSESDLRARVFAAPDDVDVRLVYADWLSDRGEAWGELVQLQMRDELTPLERARMFTILAAEGLERLGPLADYVDGVEFRRGFPWSGAVRADLPEHIVELPDWATFRRLRCPSVPLLRRLGRSTLRELELSSIEGLDVPLDAIEVVAIDAPGPTPTLELFPSLVRLEETWRVSRPNEALMGNVHDRLALAGLERTVPELTLRTPGRHAEWERMLEPDDVLVWLLERDPPFRRLRFEPLDGLALTMRDGETFEIERTDAPSYVSPERVAAIVHALGLTLRFEAVHAIHVGEELPLDRALFGRALERRFRSVTQVRRPTDTAARLEPNMVLRACIESGEQHVVDKSGFVIGRAAECALVVPHPGVAAQHVRIMHEREGWILYDNSTEGVLRNGYPIDAVRISDGDAFTLGSTTVRFSFGPERS